MARLVLKPEMKLGADKKRVAILGGLFGLLLLVWWLNRSDTPTATASVTPPRPSPSASATMPVPGPRVKTPATRPRSETTTRPGTAARSAQFGSGRGQAVEEWKPSLTPENPIDPAQVDPTLRLDVIAKLQGVKPEGGERSLFDFGQAAPKVDIAQLKPVIPKPIKGIMTGPVQPPKPAPPPPPPPPPPIPLKFYGFAANRPGLKRAFFLEGDDIYVAGEGETIKSRYKVIRIGVNSAVVEDTSNKNQQTLPLVQEVQEAS